MIYNVDVLCVLVHVLLLYTLHKQLVQNSMADFLSNVNLWLDCISNCGFCGDDINSLPNNKFFRGFL